MKIVNYIYDIYIKWYNAKYFKRRVIRKYNNQRLQKYNPFTILQFYLIFLTITTITIGLIILITLIVQSLIN